MYKVYAVVQGKLVELFVENIDSFLRYVRNNPDLCEGVRVLGYSIVR